MSRVFIGLLVSTLLPKLEALQFHANNHQKFTTKPDEFDKPSSVRLQSNVPFSASIYKCPTFRNACNLNVYNVFSNDQQSDRLRSDYEVWNSDSHTPHCEQRIARLSKRREGMSELNREILARSKARFTKLVDSPENKPYILDDDYSLVNYVDNWKGLDSDHKIRRFHRKSEKKVEGKPHQKRDTEDKEFQVEFHGLKKENEFRGSSYELVNERRRKPSINRKFKSHYRSKYNRNYEYFDPATDHFQSKPKYAACKKKRVLWGRKRSKMYPKLGPKSGFLDELETKSRSNMGAMGHVWHWATTRNYVMAAITPRKEFVTPHSQGMGMPPQAFAPVMNLSDSIVRESFAKINPPQMNPAAFRNAAAVQRPFLQYNPNGNLQAGLPPSKEVALALKPVLNQAPINMGNPTRRPLIYFNRPTEFINPYENHYENFKNTPFWNARQGPPAFKGVWGSPVRLSNIQRFTITPNIMQNQQPINPVQISLPGLFGNILEDPKAKLKNDSGVREFKFLPVAKQDAVSVKQTSKMFEPADIVNLLQSALLPQNSKAHEVATSTEETPCATLPKSIALDKMLDMIAPSRSTAIAISKPLTQSTENAVNSAADEPKLIVDATKEALISLFTTEEPMMESLEDLLRRNTDRKIPIVYDIEEAPQLSAQKSNNNTENPVKNISTNQDETTPESHTLNRRGILKKNKTAVHKTVQKIQSANTTLTTPWIVLATTENMLYSEIMQMERQKMNMTQKSKARKFTSKNKIKLFKNKLKPNETTNEPPKSMDEAKVKSKRDQKAVADSRSGKSYYQPVTSELRCGKCSCCCHTTPRPTRCCRCREKPPLELTTKPSCGPASLSSGSISCPDCHQEFTYNLGLRPLNG